MPFAPAAGSDQPDHTQPLAARMRPRTLDEVAGQQQLIGPGKVLRRMIEADAVPSMIFWGPPGVGKTTLARVIAHQTRAAFIDFSAVTSGIKEIREVMKRADSMSRAGGRTIVFIDEIHRFNKAQQDAFLPFVEKGGGDAPAPRARGPARVRRAGGADHRRRPCCHRHVQQR